jgi:Tetrahydrodipicolinate N-succinyltransferase N-terminal
MSNAALEAAVESAWEAREGISPATKGEARDAIEATLTALDSGSLRVAEKRGSDWHVNQWAKKAVLLSFRLTDMHEISGSNGGSNWWDKVPSKWQGWTEADWRKAGFRAVPGSIVRRSAFIGKGVVLMPSFVNIGAYVDEGSMVDGWATVGSCAQIGRNVHLSGGVGIGGVLEHHPRRFRAGDGGLHRQVDQDRRPRDGRGHVWRSSRRIGRRGGVDAVEGRDQPLLRRDREEGRCPDPVENQHQRAFARLTGLRHTEMPPHGPGLRVAQAGRRHQG